MFGSLGGAELLLILVLALLLFGPRKLPEIGRTIGKGMSEFRKATSEFRTSLEREVDLSEVKQARDDLKGARREVSEAIAQAREAGAPRRPSESAADAPEPGQARDEPDDDDRRT